MAFYIQFSFYAIDMFPIPTQHTLSHGCPTDIIFEYHDNHKISWMVSVIQRISRGCASIHMCEILRTKWKCFKIPYGSEKYVIVLLLHEENELF